MLINTYHVADIIRSKDREIMSHLNASISMYKDVTKLDTACDCLLLLLSSVTKMNYAYDNDLSFRLDVHVGHFIRNVDMTNIGVLVRELDEQIVNELTTIDSTLQRISAEILAHSQEITDSQRFKLEALTVASRVGLTMRRVIHILVAAYPLAK